MRRALLVLAAFTVGVLAAFFGIAWALTDLDTEEY